jgi:hypothetical protein
MKVIKDVYLYILKFVDNKSVIRMLSLNKKFLDDTYFECVTKEKYPYLVCHKSDNTRCPESIRVAFCKKQNTWKYFFSILSYNIDKLNDLGIPYIPEKSFNPMKFVEHYTLTHKHKLYNIYNIAMFYAVKSGNSGIIKCLIEKGANNFSGAVSLASHEKREKLAEELETIAKEKGYDCISKIIPKTQDFDFDLYTVLGEGSINAVCLYILKNKE